MNNIEGALLGIRNRVELKEYIDTLPDDFSGVLIVHQRLPGDRERVDMRYVGRTTTERLFYLVHLAARAIMTVQMRPFDSGERPPHDV
jgi:hypothetical protein